MSEQPISVSADDLHATDSELVQELRAGLEDIQAGHVVSADQVAADLRARSTTA